MSDSPDTRDTGRVFERHFQSALTGLLCALCLWMGSTIQKTAVEVATLSTTINQLEKRLDQAARDVYTGADAVRDLAIRDRELQKLDDRVKKLEDAR